MVKSLPDDRGDNICIMSFKSTTLIIRKTAVVKAVAICNKTRAAVYSLK